MKTKPVKVETIFMFLMLKAIEVFASFIVCVFIYDLCVLLGKIFCGWLELVDVISGFEYFAYGLLLMVLIMLCLYLCYILLEEPFKRWIKFNWKLANRFTNFMNKDTK